MVKLGNTLEKLGYILGCLENKMDSVAMLQDSLENIAAS